MSWRGMGGGIAAAKAGHDVVMAPTEWTYFDYPNTPVEKVYSFEPVPNELSAGQGMHVLGAQAQMWTDTHPTEDQIDALVYPRAVALAEVVWSSPVNRNYHEFEDRLRAHLPRLAALGVHYKPLVGAGRVIGHWSPAETSDTPKASREQDATPSPFNMNTAKAAIRSMRWRSFRRARCWPAISISGGRGPATRIMSINWSWRSILTRHSRYVPR